MLNKAEKFQVLRLIRYWCKIGFHPARVDLYTWEILPHTRRQVTWICHSWFFLFVLHALYKLVSLAYWLKVGIPLYEAVIHAIMAILPPGYIYWYYVLYIKYPRLYGVYLNMTLAGNKDEASEDEQNVRSWSRRLKECTLQDIFATVLTYTVSLANTAIMLTFVSNRSMKYLLYAALPNQSQTWITFGILLFEEMRYIFFLGSVGAPIFMLQVIAFDLVGNKLQLLIDCMQRASRPQRSEHIYKSLRHIQLYMGTVNLINSNIIFICKVLFISISVGTGYAAIAHFGDYPIFGVMYYGIFLNAAFIYIFCYDKAFKIPALFQKATQHAMLHTRRENVQATKIFKRQMRSIPQMGIKVGDFHMMERQSTLNFIHFVLTNIVNMLVTFRGN